MSRPAQSSSMQAWSFPRVSGDEPTRREATQRDDPFSPRERG